MIKMELEIMDSEMDIDDDYAAETFDDVVPDDTPQRSARLLRELATTKEFFDTFVTDKEEDEAVGGNPSDDEFRPKCRICRGVTGNVKKSPCSCKGSVGYMHDRCLKQWMRCRNRTYCEICTSKFELKRKRSYSKLIGNFFKKNYFNVVVQELVHVGLFVHLSYIQVTEIWMLLDMFIKEEKAPSPLEIFFPTMIAFTGVFNLMVLEWAIRSLNKLHYKLTYLWYNDCFVEDEEDDGEVPDDETFAH